MSKKQGFASLKKDRLKEVSSKGGRRKVRKGFATLTLEERQKMAQKASKARWEKIKQEKQVGQPINAEPINDADGGVKEQG